MPAFLEEQRMLSHSSELSPLGAFSFCGGYASSDWVPLVVNSGRVPFLSSRLLDKIESRGSQRSSFAFLLG